MYRNSKGWTFAALILLSVVALAAKKEKKKEGRQLLDHAAQASDIRAVGSPGFQLKANFKVINEGSTTEGTYAETWLSRGQWRQETTIGDLHRTVVANGRKVWTLTAVSQSMTGIDELGFPMDRVGPASEFWKADKFEDRDIRSLPARCLETKADSQGSRSALCFAKDNGILLIKAFPTEVQGKIVESTCEYRDYQEFGGKVFPRQILCFEAQKPVFEENIIELATAPAPDPAMLLPPTGATESPHCQGVIKPPKPIDTPDPELPRRETPRNPVDIELLVQEDGKPGDLKVVRSVDEAFDQAALKAVRKWQFKPATCDGVPLTTHVTVSVNFRSY